MWHPKNIRLVNFMTHLDTSFSFTQNVVTLFQGINYDNKLRSNGSGKSTILEGITYSLLGSGLKKGTDSELVRNDENSAFLRLELENSRNKFLLIIEREIFTKGSSKLSILLNGIDQKDKFSTVPEGNKFILDLIGISRKDLLNYYLISKEKYISYYSSSDTDKKDVISRFSKADKIDGIDKTIQVKLNEFSNKNAELERACLKIETQIDTYREQIEEEKQLDHARIKAEKIVQYHDKICLDKFAITTNENTVKLYQKQNSILEAQVKRYEKIIGKYTNQLSLFKCDSYSKELSNINKKEEKLKLEEKQLKLQKESLEKELDESKLYLKNIENNLKGIIECPKCTHEFLLDSDFDIEEGKKEKPLFQEGIDLLISSINKVKQDIDNFRSKYKSVDLEREVYRIKIREINEQKNVIQLKIQRCNNGIKNIQLTLKNNLSTVNTLIQNNNTLSNNITNFEKLINDLQNEQVEDNVQKLQEKINELNLQKVEVESKIQDLESERFKHEQWIHNFTRFKSFLANKSIKSIESLTNMMLKRMDSSLRVQLEGYTLLKSGELREKITSHILRDGFNEGSFFKLSGGEKGDIEIATINGIQQLINLNSPLGGIDLSAIDEILESVDGIGMVYIAKAASKLNKTMILITHVNIPSDNDYNVVTIEKRNKISKII